MKGNKRRVPLATLLITTLMAPVLPAQRQRDPEAQPPRVERRLSPSGVLEGAAYQEPGNIPVAMLIGRNRRPEQSGSTMEFTCGGRSFLHLALEVAHTNGSTLCNVTLEGQGEGVNYRLSIDGSMVRILPNHTTAGLGFFACMGLAAAAMQACIESCSA